MLPFSYPTTTLIVDDDPILLETLSTSLEDSGILCKSISDTRQAQDYITEQANQALNIENFFSAHQNIHDMDANDHGDFFLKIKSTYWFPILQSQQRFREISTAVIDYGMPTVDGLELCRRVKDLPLKKIMLTGRADKELAVQAFNEKIIDSFILKTEDNILHKLTTEIANLTEQYFLEKTQPLKLALSLQETQFVSDPAFMEYFNTITEDKEIVEHYVNPHPPGILMFDAAGKPDMLLVYNTERIRAHIEIAQETNAPMELQQVLGSLQVLPLFPTPTGYYHPSLAAEWKNHIYPAQKIEGKQTLLVAKMRNTDFVLEHLNNYVSLEQLTK